MRGEGEAIYASADFISIAETAISTTPMEFFVVIHQLCQKNELDLDVAHAVMLDILSAAGHYKNSPV